MMTTSPSASTAYMPPTSLPDLEQFSETAPDRDPKKVAKDFESVFIAMMLKSMRESMSKEMFAGDTSDTFGGLFDSMMGQELADQGGLGLAEMILASGLKGIEKSNATAGASAEDSSGANDVQATSKAIQVYQNASANA